MECDKCSKTITGEYHYNPDKKDEGKKFCSLYCMHQYYGEPCEQCGKKSAQWIYSPEKNDGKKFCSSYCSDKYYRSQGGNSPKSEGDSSSSSSNFNWKDYQGWIIGGVIVVVILIILGVIFGGKKKRR